MPKLAKDSWGPGPWLTEPDRIQWTDPATGFVCLIRRSPIGVLCGYVGIPPSHRFYGIHFDAIDVSVHGGLSYAAACDGDSEQGICHVPAPGQPDDLYWLGFDCAHSGDLIPPILRSGFYGATEYRDISYVRRECERLATQLYDPGEPPPGEENLVNCTIDKLTEMVVGRPLTCGAHKPGEEWCILEARSQCAGIDWTDDPGLNRTFDIRPINDIPVPISLRTEWMPRVMEAYEGALDWPYERQVAVASKIATNTMRLITCLPEGETDRATKLADDMAAQSSDASIMAAIKPDPEAAAERSADALSWAAAAVAEAAAGEAAKKAAMEEIFISGCQLWIEAAS